MKRFLLFNSVGVGVYAFLEVVSIFSLEAFKRGSLKTTTLLSN